MEAPRLDLPGQRWPVAGKSIRLRPESRQIRATGAAEFCSGQKGVESIRVRIILAPSIRGSSRISGLPGTCPACGGHFLGPPRSWTAHQLFFRDSQPVYAGPDCQSGPANAPQLTQSPRLRVGQAGIPRFGRNFSKACRSYSTSATRTSDTTVTKRSEPTSMAYLRRGEPNAIAEGGTEPCRSLDLRPCWRRW